MLELIQKYPAGALAAAVIAVELVLLAWLAVELAAEFAAASITNLFR